MSSLYLCDTNVISELVRPRPNPGVVGWASTIGSLQLSAITVEELQFGLSWKPNARVLVWIDRFVAERCAVVPVTGAIARRCGLMRGQLRARGQVRTQADMLIAATAAEEGLTLVTRNTRDFDGCGIALLDPFR